MRRRQINFAASGLQLPRLFSQTVCSSAQMCVIGVVRGFKFGVRVQLNSGIWAEIDLKTACWLLRIKK